VAAVTWFERRPQREPQPHDLGARVEREVARLDFAALGRAAGVPTAPPAAGPSATPFPFADASAERAHPARSARFGTFTGVHAAVGGAAGRSAHADPDADSDERDATEAAEASARAAAAAAEAAAEAQRRLDEAHEEGRRAGAAEAYEVATAEAAEAHDVLRAEVIAALAANATELAGFRQRELERMREGAIQLVRVLTQHLLQVELRFRPEALLSVATATIGEAVGLGDIVVSVNPEALEALTDRLAELRAAHPDPGAAVQIVPDAAVGYGSCVVRSRLGEIHDDLEERLERLVGLLWMRWPLPPGAAAESNASADVAAVPASAVAPAADAHLDAGEESA
jgi:flagellar biosynthesis/type III secretory pathway protein FliH